MMYLLLSPESDLPNIMSYFPFQVIIVSEESVTPEWMNKTCKWLMKSGCRDALSWGKECKEWHAALEAAIKEAKQNGDTPAGMDVENTWHEKEALSQVFWISKNSDYYTSKKKCNALILHISNTDNCGPMQGEYERM